MFLPLCVSPTSVQGIVQLLLPLMSVRYLNCNIPFSLEKNSTEVQHFALDLQTFLCLMFCLVLFFPFLLLGFLAKHPLGT